jgi:ribokinase
MEVITVIGSINMDLVVQVDRMPKSGETLAGVDFHLIPGGKGANQAVAARRAGAQTRIVGCVGEDAFGAVLLDSLNEAGVDTKRVQPVPNISSGTATIIVEENGDNRIIVVAGTNKMVTPSMVEKNWHLISDTSLIILQNEIPQETIFYVIQRAKQEGIQVLLNPAPTNPIPDQVLSNIDILILNEIEAATLSNTPISDPKTAFDVAQSLYERGVKTVIITLGEQGSVLVNNHYHVFQPAFNVEVVDTTAAGDTFVGGYAAATLGGSMPLQALLYATAAAGLAVTQLGAQPSIPSRDDVVKFIRQISSSTKEEKKDKEVKEEDTHLTKI